ncbi:MAG: hypothetical protein IKL47_05210 [Clostridia bacterium]|nr:hypothetical protein [Clostridia bacterium]
MTFIEKFDYLKKKYALKADTSKLKENFIAAQITMSDEDCGGTMYAAFIDGKFSFEPYDYHDNTVAIIIDSNLLEECIKGKADPVKSYLDGTLQAWGNLDHALQLIECLKGKEKAPAKKEETKEKKSAKRNCKKSAKTEEIAEPEKAVEVKAEEISVPAEEKKTAKRSSKKTAQTTKDEKPEKKKTKKTAKEK